MPAVPSGLPQRPAGQPTLVIPGVSFVLGFVVAIVMGVQIGNIDSRLAGTAVSSNCASQGGSDPSC